MNKYIQQLINEQFNINDLDFSDDDSSMDVNIFNKKLHTIYDDIYEEILDTRKVSKKQLGILKDVVAVITPKNRSELETIIKIYSYKNYIHEPLNWLDVSEIDNMSSLFYKSKYTGDISRWDVSNVVYMHCMFCRSDFNGSINEWDVSNVTNMHGMFNFSAFDQDISQWDVSHVSTMSSMFLCSYFNQDISGWDISNVKDMSYMFAYSDFNKDISGWDISNKQINSMFECCKIKEKYKPIKLQ